MYVETAEQRLKLSQMVTDLYENAGVDTEPMFPKILVRVLPREQKVGSIYLPDGQQNKPVWEGIVIRTYKPFYQKIYLTDAHWVKDDPNPEVRYTQKVECELKPGDHVLFPHIEYGITPVTIDGGKGEYRCVPEQHILAKVNHFQEKTHGWLRRLIEDDCDLALSDDEMDDLVDLILENADVVRRDITSVTMSGR